MTENNNKPKGNGWKDDANWTESQKAVRSASIVNLATAGYLGDVPQEFGDIGQVARANALETGVRMAIPNETNRNFMIATGQINPKDMANSAVKYTGAHFENIKTDEAYAVANHCRKAQANGDYNGQTLAEVGKTDEAYDAFLRTKAIGAVQRVLYDEKDKTQEVLKGLMSGEDSE